MKVIRNAVIALLVFTFMVIYFVLPSSAVELAKDTFVIDGNYYSDISQDLNGKGWSWDASEFKLTLDGYNSSFIVFVPATESSKTLKIVAKNNNFITYNKDETPCPVDRANDCVSSSHECYFCGKFRDIAALYVKNCLVNISGGILNIKALGNNANAISLFGNSTIENTILNCFATGTSIETGLFIAKKSTINMDSYRAFASNVNCNECKISYKNSDINNTYCELINSGGEHIFKNSTFEITLGARPLDNNKIHFSGFQGSARYEFDNTIVKLKQGPHNNIDNSSVLFSLGYPEMFNNWLKIKNNSRFELDECIDCAFSAFEVSLSDSTIVGTYGETLFATAKLNVTNSNIDVECKGNDQREFVEAHEVSIKNSNVKVKTKGELWSQYPYDIFETPIEKKLTLVDTCLDLEGKVDKFGDKWSLDYTTPEKWMVILDGMKSDLSINSTKLDIRHKKLVIKVDENYKPNQSKPILTTSSQSDSENKVSTSDIDNSSLVDDLNSVNKENQSVVQSSNGQNTDETIGIIPHDNNSENSTVKIVLVIGMSLLIVCVIGLVAFVCFKNKKKG